MSFQLFFEYAPLILFAFARIVALIFVAPILNSSAIPPLAKAGLALAVSLVTLPHLIENGYTFPNDAGLFLILLLGEILIGVLMGFIVQLYFSVFQITGELFSQQIGLGMSSALDGMGEVELPLLGQFFNLMGMYLFLSVRGLNELFFNGIYLSFIKVRPQELFGASSFLNEFFITSLGRIFLYSLQVALPILIILFLVSVVLGILSKIAPQMNLLMLGYSFNLIIGFFFLVLVFPVFLNFFNRIIEMGFDLLLEFFGAGGES